MKGNFHKLLKTLKDKYAKFDLTAYEKDIYKRHKEWVEKENGQEINTNSNSKKI